MVKCIECGKEVCRQKAALYKDPLNKLCNECRQREIFRLAEKI